MTVHNQGGPCIELEHSLPSEVAAISPRLVEYRQSDSGDLFEGTAVRFESG
jgi:hypothetical protein